MLFSFIIRHLSSVSNFSWYWNTFVVKSAIDIDITGTNKGIVIRSLLRFIMHRPLLNRIPRVPLKVEVISKLHSIS